MCGASTCTQPMRRMGAHTMGAARDERARASANENELSANLMMRPMGVSVLPVDTVVLPEWLLWFMCYGLSFSSLARSLLCERERWWFELRTRSLIVLFKSYVGTTVAHGYVRRPGTDRIPEGVPRKFLRNRNRDSCEKSATGEETQES